MHCNHGQRTNDKLSTVLAGGKYQQHLKCSQQQLPGSGVQPDGASRQTAYLLFRSKIGPDPLSADLGWAHSFHGNSLIIIQCDDRVCPLLTVPGACGYNPPQNGMVGEYCTFTCPRGREEGQ
jgi:hypothetical protein